MKKNLKWIICSITFIIFIVLSILIFTKKDVYLDSYIYTNISKYISDDLTLVISNLTHLASAIVVLVVTLFSFIFFKNKKYGIFLLLDLILITIFQYVLKFIFVRPRPININIIEASGYSFPSGHSLTAMAFYGFIIYLVHISKLSKLSKIIYTILFSIIILVVGLSRIYLGVHFFTDVLGAFCFSISFLIIYINIIKDKLR